MTEKEAVFGKLAYLQQSLKAPKSQFNSFGKYHYRSCEDILEALKPLLGEATVMIGDEMVMVGRRYYVKATVMLTLLGNSVSCSAYAREEDDKKGMDASQITGAASSYARKYALNGLFLIDDTKDADTSDNTKEEKKKDPEPTPKKDDANSHGYFTQDDIKAMEPEKGRTPTRKITDAQRKRFYAIAKSGGWSDDAIKTYMKNVLGVESSHDIPVDRYEEACKWGKNDAASD